MNKEMDKPFSQNYWRKIPTHPVQKNCGFVKQYKTP